MFDPSKRLRLGAMVLIGLVAFAALLYVWWWSQLASRARAEIGRFMARTEAAGGHVETGDLTVSGFPLRLRLKLSAPAIALADGTFWKGPPLDLDLVPWDPTHLRFAAPGRHEVGFQGLTREVEAADATGEVDWTSLGPKSIGLTLSGVAVAGVRAGRIEARVSRLAFGPVAYDVPSLALSLKAEDVVLSPLPVAAPGPVSGTLVARLLGRVPAAAAPRDLAAWRDEGGTVEIDTLALSCPPVALSGKATLALDRDLQPELAGTAVVRGLIEALDRFTLAHMLQPKEANLAKLVLGFLGHPAADGVMEWNVPVAIQNRTLSLGPAAVAELPRLTWGEDVPGRER